MTTAVTDLRPLIESELDELVGLRRFLHANPELAYDEHRTAEIVRRELGTAGVEFRGGLAGGTGVLGHLPGTAQEAIGLRADMDALPIAEETTLPYASTQEGVMHACGHDGHTTILIGAARVLARIAAERPLPRPVTFVFQPAEEGGAGGKRMVDEGCLDGSVIGNPVAAIYGLHGWPSLALGHVATKSGPLLAAADKFTITLRGTGAHAAFPHLGNDTIVAASAMVASLQSIASRSVDPLDAAVVSTSTIHGGTTFNILPDQVQLTGTVRTLRPETQTLVIDRLKAIAEHVARAHGCTADVDYEIGYPVTANDPTATAVFAETARDALGESCVQEVPQPYMGGEDFAFYGQRVPACFFLLGLLARGRTMAQLHQSTFDFNDDAITTGVEIFCRLALREAA